jgi:hypothetical protein
MVPDSRRKPALDAFMASGAGIHGDTLGCHYFPEDVAVESLAARRLLSLAPCTLVAAYPCVVAAIYGSCHAPGGVSPCDCVCICSSSQWSILQCLALPSSSVFHSGYFATIVSLKRDAWSSLFSLADALLPLSLVSSLADALLLRVQWPFPSVDALPEWASLLLPQWMLCCHWLFSPLSGKCFTAERALTTSWRILGRRGRLVFASGCFVAVVTGCLSVFSGRLPTK